MKTARYFHNISVPPCTNRPTKNQGNVSQKIRLVVNIWIAYKNVLLETGHFKCMLANPGNNIHNIRDQVSQWINLNSKIKITAIMKNKPTINKVAIISVMFNSLHPMILQFVRLLSWNFSKNTDKRYKIY